MNPLPLALAFFMGSLLFAHGIPEPTSIELLVDHSPKPLYGPHVAVPYDTSTLQFLVKPESLRVRYKLEGLDSDWQQRTEEMFFIVRFLNKNGDQVSQEAFSAKGASRGWKGSVERSEFTSRREIVKVPEDAESISVVMSSAGPATTVGIIAISGITISSVAKGAEMPVTYLKNGRVPGSDSFIWSKSGTHPSMASTSQLDNGSAEVFVIKDDDIKAHADWVTTLRDQPKVVPGESLELLWSEVYCSGAGGPFSATYERLPSGSYRFVVEDLAITGEPLNSGTAMAVKVPLPYWKNFWFWAVCAAVIAVLSTLYGRHLIRKRINLHLRHAQLIADERLRIARDLHDDLGTRLSHIALLGAYAESNNPDGDARAAFGQITTMSRELISALSETVWMLNPKNNQLEALVDFLCRLVSELCRLSEIRCRIDAMSVTSNVTISHEFRHNMSLAVKEIVNNALRHSFATEIKMSIQLENTQLKIAVTDNGVGITREPNKTSLGLENINQRMSSIRGKCTIDKHEKEGLKITLEAPIV
ncbi:MAG: histidine kinase [Verrucomicrobiota bacterium]